MNSSDFARLTNRRVTLITNYMTNEAPGMVIRKTLRFIDGNFRAQGWQGATFEPWKKNRRNGLILIWHGALRRGNNYSNLSNGTIRFYNNMPYSGAHNRGFKGTVNVKAHTRAQYTKTKVFAVNEFTRSGKHKQRTVTTKTGETFVKAHARKMDLVKRQFAPYEGHESPVMNNSIGRELEREVRKFLTY